MPITRTPVVEIAVTPRDAEEFVSALECTINTLSADLFSRLYLFPEYRKAIAISLDGAYRPFLGFTSGLNPPDQRAHLPGRLNFMAQIADLIDARNPAIAGGRVFIAQFSASKVIDGQEQTLCVYDWPGASPVSIAARIFIARVQAVLPPTAAD